MRTDLTGNILIRSQRFSPFQLTGQNQGITVRWITVLLALKCDVNTAMNTVQFVQASLSII